MRKTLSLLCLVAFLGLTVPAQAQFRHAVEENKAPARLYDANGAAGFVLNKLFNPSVFRMSHSFEMSAGSFGGNSYSMGMYTNTMAWQFNDKFAARMDVAVAYSPHNEAASALGVDNQRPQVFLRNAEIAWRPSEKFQLHLQVRQSPYGSYMSPYGAYSPYGYGYGGYGYHRTALMHGSFGGPSPDLFWRDSHR